MSNEDDDDDDDEPIVKLEFTDEEFAMMHEQLQKLTLLVIAFADQYGAVYQKYDLTTHQKRLFFGEFHVFNDAIDEMGV